MGGEGQPAKGKGEGRPSVGERGGGGGVAAKKRKREKGVAT
jgi:hypothetical protein